MNDESLQKAYTLLNRSVICCDGRPIGTAAVGDPDRPPAKNHGECFIRDFFVSGLVFLADGNPGIVRAFLLAVLDITEQEHESTEASIHPSVMPASFRVVRGAGGSETLEGDFGDLAIGRVAPVDSLFWWTWLLCVYVDATGDVEITRQDDVQNNLERVLALSANDAFEVFPTLMVPDGAFMVDRRMGVYGHPLEIQALFYRALRGALRFLTKSPENQRLVACAEARAARLRDYVRKWYWIDLFRMRDIHRFPNEEFGKSGVNLHNIQPDAVPEWVAEWVGNDAGYFAGNLGPGRMDFRFFAQGNLLAILFGLATAEQTAAVMRLFESHWPELIGQMPLKLCYPALEGEAWCLLTGGDSKNRPWSYHNAGNWPVLLWVFVAAALKTGNNALAQRAYQLAAERLEQDAWPEYYDGKSAGLIGRYANLNQTWTAAALILADKLLKGHPITPLLFV